MDADAENSQAIATTDQTARAALAARAARSADGSETSDAPTHDAKTATTTSTVGAADSDITLEGFVTMWPAVMDTLSHPGGLDAVQ